MAERNSRALVSEVDACHSNAEHFRGLLLLTNSPCKEPNHRFLRFPSSLLYFTEIFCTLYVYTHVFTPKFKAYRTWLVCVMPLIPQSWQLLLCLQRNQRFDSRLNSVLSLEDPQTWHRCLVVSALHAPILDTCINILFCLLCVSLHISPPPPPPPSAQGSVPSSLLLMKTVVCSSTWVACLYSQSSHNSPGPLFFNFFFILLHSLSSRALRFSNRPAMPFDVGRRGFIQVWRPVLPPPSLWCCVHPQPGAGASSESPVFRAPEMNRGPVDGARLWGPVVSPLLHAEAWICYRPGRLPAGEERGWLKGSYDALAHALTAGELIRRCVCVCLRVSMCPPCAHVLPPWLSACPTCLTEHLCVCLN